MNNLIQLVLIIAVIILALFLRVLWLRVRPKQTPNDDKLTFDVVPAFQFNGLDESLAGQVREAINRMGGAGLNAEEKYQVSLKALQPDSTVVINAIGDELDIIPTSRYLDRWSLIQLIAELQNPESLTLLGKILSKPMPVEKFKDPHKRSSLREETIILTTAVEAITRIASKGNTSALDLLLKFTGHKSLSVRRASVQGYYTHFGEGAREKLLEVLPQSDHYLLEIRKTNIENISPIRVKVSDIPFRTDKDVTNDVPRFVPKRDG
ncbi:hypothetical protein ACFL6G_04875 [candidate division KSB1 bacterium]